MLALRHSVREVVRARADYIRDYLEAPLEIDRLVCRFYSLTQDEIAIVERPKKEVAE